MHFLSLVAMHFKVCLKGLRPAPHCSSTVVLLWRSRRSLSSVAPLALSLWWLKEPEPQQVRAQDNIVLTMQHSFSYSRGGAGSGRAGTLPKTAFVISCFTRSNSKLTIQMPHWLRLSCLMKRLLALMSHCKCLCSDKGIITLIEELRKQIRSSNSCLTLLSVSVGT